MKPRRRKEKSKGNGKGKEGEGKEEAAEKGEKEGHMPDLTVVMEDGGPLRQKPGTNAKSAMLLSL